MTVECTVILCLQYRHKKLSVLNSNDIYYGYLTKLASKPVQVLNIIIYIYIYIYIYIKHIHTYIQTFMCVCTK